MNEEIRAQRQNFKKAWLVGIQHGRTTRAEVEDHLRELEALVETLGVPIAGTEIVRLQKYSPSLLIGSGKAEEIMTRLKAEDCDLLVFDDDLSPPQQQQWEAKAECAVIDRRKVIIDIFGRRAQTREAKLQVELALLEYMLPRLKSAWTHLERQRGGAGFVGGAGEAQIEVDRRLVRDRIARLKEEIEVVRRHRATQRKRREGVPMPTAAIVGYTNAGKSSLLNALTKAGVLEEDKLFATLDPTTRQLKLPSGQTLLLTDTVGFVRKLPTTLIDAFKSTLEEAAMADFLIHVVDASHPGAIEQYQTTNAILRELNAYDKPTLLVFNKVDRLYAEARGELLRTPVEVSPERVHVTSCLTGEGLDHLRLALAGEVGESMPTLTLQVPSTRHDVIAALHREGEVVEERYTDDNAVWLRVLVPPRLVPKFEMWRAEPLPIAKPKAKRSRKKAAPSPLDAG